MGRMPEWGGTQEAGAKAQGQAGSALPTDALLKGSCPCMFCVCSFEVLADASGHNRPDFPFLRIRAPLLLHSDPVPGGEVCAMEKR